MGTIWEFKSYKPKNRRDRFPIYGRFPIRRSCGPFIGTEREAVDFARRASEHLSARGVMRVEAWGAEQNEPSDLPDAITFRLHAEANDCWRAEPNQLHHGGVWPDLDGALSYALWRGAGKLCRVEVLNKAGVVQWLVLMDQGGNDVYAGKGPTLGAVRLT